MEQEPFALVQTRMELIDPDLLAGALAKHTSWPKADVNRLARRTRGILGTRFSRSEAQAVLAELKLAGVQTELVPAAQLVTLGPYQTVGWLEVSDAGLGVPLGIREEITLVPWPTVFVIHAGVIAALHDEQRIVEVQRDSKGSPEHEVRREIFGIAQPTVALGCFD